MSCFNLRLPPPKKAWQSFTSKFSLHNSKSIKKKPKFKTKKHNRTRVSFLPFKRQCRTSRFLLSQKTAPVYIDKLFREPVADELVARPLPRTKTVKALADKRAGTEDGRGKGKSVAEADDMWESSGFGSPQMRGIDQRAEQFIASFRAEMEVEEKIARKFTVESGNSS